MPLPNVFSTASMREVIRNSARIQRTDSWQEMVDRYRAQAVADWKYDIRPAPVVPPAPTPAVPAKVFDPERAWDMLVLAAKSSRYP